MEEGRKKREKGERRRERKKKEPRGRKKREREREKGRRECRVPVYTSKAHGLAARAASNIGQNFN